MLVFVFMVVFQKEKKVPDHNEKNKVTVTVIGLKCDNFTLTGTYRFD